MRYFVLMGNTRVGSTWFASSIHNLPDVYCTREIRWRMPYQVQAPRVHSYIDSTTRSIKERLEFGVRAAGKRNLVAVGAKLKFDPLGYALPSAFSELRRILEDDVHVIFLRRSYFEIFQTWRAFGIRHRANPNASKTPSKEQGSETTGRHAERLNRFHTMHRAPFKQKRVLITGDGNVIARFLHNSYGGETLYHSISDAIDDLLVLFYNDVFGLTVIDGHHNTDAFTYPEIRSKFFDVAQNLSLAVSAEECRAALNNATTSQIETPGLDLVYPVNALKEVSEHLDSVFHRIRAGGLSPDAVVRFDEQKGCVSFHLPGLVSILARHEETAGLLGGGTSGGSRLLRRVLAPTRRVEGHYSRSVRLFRSLFARRTRIQNEDWLAQRPMYVPLPQAPKPPVAPSTEPLPNPN